MKYSPKHEQWRFSKPKITTIMYFFLAISCFLLHFLGTFILSLLQISFLNVGQGEGAYTCSFLCSACFLGCCELLLGAAWPWAYFSFLLVMHIGNTQS